MLITFTAKGQQDGGMNVYSPYTMYGFGQINSLGTAENRAMAGVGVSSLNYAQANTINPAGLGATPQQSFLFNIGMSGNNNYLKTASSSSAFNNFNISELAVKFPIAKNLGFGLSMNPYSYVGYDVSTSSLADENDPSQTELTYTYSGTGGITLAKAGLGYMLPTKGDSKLAIGINALFYKQAIEHSAVATVSSPLGYYHDYRSAESVTTYTSLNVNYEVGILYSLMLDKDRRRTINFGATYEPQVTLHVENSRYIYSVNSSSATTEESEITNSDMVLPSKFTAGISYNTRKTELGLDYVYQDFTGAYELVSSSSVDNLDVELGKYQDFRLGIAHTPNRNDIRKALNRWTYRGGLSYGTSYLTLLGEPIVDYSVDFGVGVPMDATGGGQLNVGASFGQRGSLSSTSLVENYFNINLGVNLIVLREWFIRHKFK